MGIFAKYPYTNFNDLNLDWIIQRLREVENELQQYLDNAVIKFADPIAWDITEQYTALTVVVDSDGTAYLSKQPVPAGIAITDTDYWLPIFNYDDNINELRSQIAYNARESATTGQALTAGDLVFWQGVIYQVITDMAAGTAFIEGSNITPYTVDQKINDINADLQQEIADRTNAIDELRNEYAGALISAKSEPINVLTLGFKNDGSEDISDLFNTYTAQYQLYFPVGVYRVDKPLQMYNSVYGASSPKTAGRGSVLKAYFDDVQETAIIKIIAVGNGEGIELANITLDCDSQDYVGGLDFSPNTNVSGRPPFKIHNVVVNNTGANVYAVKIAPSGWISRSVYVDGLATYGGSEATTGGIYISQNAGDCMFTNLELMYARCGIRNYGSTNRFYNAQIYCGRANVADPATYYAGAIAFDNYASIFADNLYLDTAYQYFVQRSGSSVIGHIVCWCDTSMNGSGLTQGTMLRAVYPARLEINELQTGGPASARDRFAVIIGYRTTVGKWTMNEWSQLVEAKTGQLPLITPDYGRKSYSFKASDLSVNGTYMCFLIVYAGDAGFTRVYINRDAQESTIVVRRDTSNTINAILHTQPDANGGMQIYYKTSGNYVYFYNQQYGNCFNVQCDYSTVRSTDMRSAVAPLDLSAMVDYAVPYQANTTGLTLLNAT